MSFTIFDTSFNTAKTFRQSGKVQEALSLFQKLLSSLTPSEYDKRIKCLNEISHCSWRIGEYDNAEMNSNLALKLSEKEPKNVQGEAGALWNLGAISMERGDLELAEKHLIQSKTIRERISDLEGVADCVNNLGILYRQKGQLDRTLECYQHSLNLREEIGRPSGIAGAINNLGVVYWQRGELKKAEELYFRSLNISKEQGDPLGVGIPLTNLGIIFWQRGELNLAENFLYQSLSKIEKVGNPRLLGETRYHLALVHLMLRNFEQIMNQTQELKKLGEKSKLPDVIIRHSLLNGHLKLHQGELNEAMFFGNQAMTHAESVPHFGLMIEAIIFLMQVQINLFFFDDDEDHLLVCDDLLHDIEDLSKREQLYGTYAEALWIKGLLKRAMFDLKQAEKYFLQAELLANERGINLIAQNARKELKKLQTQFTKLEKVQRYSRDDVQDNLRTVLDYLKQTRQFLK